MMRQIQREEIGKILLPREKEAHKGDFGKLMIVAGSLGMAGAAVLSAKGALRSGVGTVTLTADREIFSILQTAAPEAMCRERDEGLDFSVFSSIVVGPGLGHRSSDGRVMKRIFNEYKGPLVIDADGLNNILRFDLSRDVVETQAEVIITPHMGEGARLLGIKRIGDREGDAVKLSHKYACTTILKGHETLISGEDGQVWRNTTGNPGMATGGSGDVLAGIVGSLTAQGYSPMEAAKAGVYIHGLAGDLCRDRFGEIGMTAGDLIDFLSPAFQEIMQNRGGRDGNPRIEKNCQ